MLRFCTSYNLYATQIQTITCKNIPCTCNNMYIMLLKNGFNCYNIKKINLFVLLQNKIKLPFNKCLTYFSY